MRRNWQVFWSEPKGDTGVSTVSARTVEQAYEYVQELHRQAPFSKRDPFTPTRKNI